SKYFFILRRGHHHTPLSLFFNDCISFFIIRHNCHLLNQITLHFVSNNTIFQKKFLYYILNFKGVKLIKDILSLLSYFMILFKMNDPDYFPGYSFFIWELVKVPLLRTLLNLFRDNPHAPSLLFDRHTMDF